MSTPTPSSPTLAYRTTSSLIMGITGALSKGFLFGLNRTETVGLEGFLETLDSRKDVQGRERGLITGISTLPDFLEEDELTGIGNSVKSCQRVCLSYATSRLYLSSCITLQNRRSFDMGCAASKIRLQPFKPPMESRKLRYLLQEQVRPPFHPEPQ